MNSATKGAGRQHQIVFHKPEQGLASTTQLEQLRVDQFNGPPNALIRILLQLSVFVFYKSNGTVGNQLTASGLCHACLTGPLTKQVQFIFVERSLQSEEQSVIAQSWRIDGLLIDKQRVNDAAHFDQLLPLAAVARKARDFPGAYRSHFSQANLSHHPFQAGPRYAASCRSAKVFINDLHFGPTERA